MNDEVPDLSAGPKVNELSHAALAAAQIASSRRDAAERVDAERVREAESRLADLRRARTEWRRLTDVTGRAADQLAEARFESTLASRTAAVSRQRHDGAIFDYQEALDAPSGSVPRWRLDALERAVGDTGGQSEHADALAERAADRHQRAARAFHGADAALRDFERDHGITREAAPQSEPRPTRESTAPGFASADDARMADDRHLADVWADVRTDGMAADDAVATDVNEADVGEDRARAADGLRSIKLADVDAAAAAAQAHAVAFPTHASAAAVQPPDRLAAALSGPRASRAAR